MKKENQVAEQEITGRYPDHEIEGVLLREGKPEKNHNGRRAPYLGEKNFHHGQKTPSLGPTPPRSSGSSGNSPTGLLATKAVDALKRGGNDQRRVDRGYDREVKPLWSIIPLYLRFLKEKKRRKKKRK